MKKQTGTSFFRRCLGAVLAVLFLGISTFGTAQEAGAATVYKTYYVPSKMTVTMWGDTNTWRYTYYTGDRAGLLRIADTPWGKVRVKEGLLQGQVINSAPEFEDCKRIAQESGQPLKAVEAAALQNKC